MTTAPAPPVAPNSPRNDTEGRAPNTPTRTITVVTPGDKSNKKGGSTSTVGTPATTFANSTPFGSLGDSDIVCGRGAPTNFHIGNERFKELVSGYHRAYYVAKRSDKPHIAMEILDILKTRGARFVRRMKGRSLASSQWVEVAHKIAYEKVCQALREGGAVSIPRQMLSAVAAAQHPRKKTTSPERHHKLREDSIPPAAASGNEENLPVDRKQRGAPTTSGDRTAEGQE